MRSSARALTLAALAALAASCDGGVTELVLVVDTAIPGVDRFVVDVTYPSGRTGTSSADLSERRAPRTLVLVHRAGELGPVVLRVRALAGARTVAEVQRSLFFAAGRSLRLVVRIHPACEGLTCDVGLSCGNEGRCRPVEVPPCEVTPGGCAALDAGADAAPDDASTVDAPQCPGVGVCGIADTHLPGDRVAPQMCPPLGSTPTVSVSRMGTPLPDLGGGAFLLRQPGPHSVTLTLPDGCASTRAFEVVGPLVLGGVGTTGTLRDLAARPGAAFVVGAEGAWAVDPRGWTDLYSGPTPPSVRDLSAAAVQGAGNVVLGTSADTDLFLTIRTTAPFDALAFTEVPMPAPARRTTAGASRLDRAGAVLLATPDGLVRVTFFPSSGAPLGPAVETHWIAMGAFESGDRGAVWAGASGKLWNVSLSDGGTFAAGAPSDVPAEVGTIRAAELDDRAAEHRLWLCGDAAVGMVDLAAVDWSAAATFPELDATYAMPCEDLAIGSDGHAWVARGGAGVTRLNERGSEVLTYGAEQGLAGAPQFDRVGFAADETSRQLWLLDSANRQVLLYAADAWRRGS